MKVLVINPDINKLGGLEFSCEKRSFKALFSRGQRHAGVFIVIFPRIISVNLVQVLIPTDTV